MLIEIKVKNFRSFREEQSFSMAAESGKEHLGTHTFPIAENAFPRLLRSAAIYGANSAGKTNLLRALQFVRELVITSAGFQPNTPIAFSPYGFDQRTKRAPSEFEITFYENGTRYEYAFSADAERIWFERLIEYPEGKPRRLFLREYRKSDGKYFWDLSKTHLKGPKVLWREATKDNSLFLSVAVQQNSQELLPAFQWFQKRLVVIAGNTHVNPSLTHKMLSDDPTMKDSILSFLRVADPGIADLQIAREPVAPGSAFMPGRGVYFEANEAGSVTTSRVKFVHASDLSNATMELPADDESSGALALFQSAGPWLNVLRNGEVMLFDEMDSSLHPFLARYLIRQFHSNSANKRNAQLIFTTHNAFLLTQELFRRDQIWFVEKQFGGDSSVYPLTRFAPRKETEDIQRWYFRGKYGALPILEEFGIEAE